MADSPPKLKQRLLDRLSFGAREKKFAKTSVFYYASNLFSILSRAITTFILLKFLGTHDYGLLVLAMSVSGTLSGFLDFRAHEGIVRFSMESMNKEKGHEVHHVILLGHVISSAIAIITYILTYLTAPFVAVYFLHHSVEKTLIQIYGIVWFFSAFTVTPYSIFLIFKEHALLNKLMTLNYILKFVFPVVLLPFRLKGVLAGFIVANCLSAVIFLYMSSRILFKNLPPCPIDTHRLFKTAREMSPFMAHTFLSETLKSFGNYFNILVLGYFRTPTEVSYFKIAASYAGLTAFITNPVSPLVFSKLSQLWTEKKKKLFDTALLKGRLYLFLVSFAVSLSLALPARFLISFLFGHETNISIQTTYLMLLSFLFMNTFSWVRPYVLAIGRPEISTWLNILYIAFSFPLAILCTLYYGAAGTAFSAFLSYATLYLALNPWLLKQRK